MIEIVNKGPFRGTSPANYEVSINGKLIVRFQHTPVEGLAVCLAKAALAVREHLDAGSEHGSEEAH